MTNTNGEVKLDEVYGEDGPCLKSDLMQVCEETESITTEMKDVINIHAEAIAFCRFVLERFVPAPLFAKAAKDYYEARAKEIDIAAGTEAIDVGATN